MKTILSLLLALLAGNAAAQITIGGNSGGVASATVTNVVLAMLRPLTNNFYGGLSISNAAITLATAGTPAAITNWTRKTDANGIGAGLTNGLLYVTNAGRYLVGAQVTFLTTTTAATNTMEIYLDAQATGIRLRIDAHTNNSANSGTLLGLLNIAAGQTVSLRQSTVVSETITNLEAQLFVSTFGGGGLTETMGTNIANAVSLANAVGLSNAYTVRILGSANVFTNAQAIQPLVAGPALTVRRATAGQTNDVQTWQAQDNSTLARLSSNGTFHATGFFSAPTQTAHATSLAVDAGRNVFLDATNTTSANVSILLTNCLPGTSGSLRLLSDASARTISLFSGATLTPISTNATVNSTNLITTASKHLLLCYRVSQESPIKTNVLYWAIAQP